VSDVIGDAPFAVVVVHYNDVVIGVALFLIGTAESDAIVADDFRIHLQTEAVYGKSFQHI